MREKKTFLLFELLIALSLMATLLSLLFSFLIQSIRVEQKINSSRKSILERQNFQIRLQDILTAIYPETDGSSIYTKTFPKETALSLVTSFDLGIDPNPMFCGAVQGRIYLDKQRNLCLAYWPREREKTSQENKKPKIWRKEILFSHVSDIEFQFLDTHEKTKKAIWCKIWPKEKSSIPSMIRIIIKTDHGTIQSAFCLPYSKPILYPSSSYL
jgi:hypothetical protein